MDKCINCPLNSHAAIPCPARTLPHPRFCRWMDPEDDAHQPDGARPILILAGVLPPENPTGTVAVGHPTVHVTRHAGPLAGDVVEAFAKRIGADRLAKWTAKQLTGVPSCGCESRRDALNRMDLKARKLLRRLAGRGEA